MGLIYSLFIKLDRFIIVQNFNLGTEIIQYYKELVNALQKCFIGGVGLTKLVAITVFALL
jgi:hypothetical protein